MSSINRKSKRWFFSVALWLTVYEWQCLCKLQPITIFILPFLCNSFPFLHFIHYSNEFLCCFSFYTHICYDERPYLDFVLDSATHQVVMPNLDNHLTCQASNLFDKLKRTWKIQRKEMVSTFASFFSFGRLHLTSLIKHLKN